NLKVTGALKVWNTGSPAPGGTRVNLSAGTLDIGSLDTNGNAARFNWTGGTLIIGGIPQGPVSLTANAEMANSILTVGVDGPFGELLDLGPSKSLRLRGNGVTVDSAACLAATGGGLAAGSLL